MEHMGDGNLETVKKKKKKTYLNTLNSYVDPEAIARAANDDGFALSFARIECHYFVNGAFMRSDNQVRIQKEHLFMK